MALGVPHPDYLKEMLNGRQLRDWEIVYSIEPFGEQSDWIRTGRICSTLVNLKLKKESKGTKPLDFVPKFYHGKNKEQTTMDMKNLMSSMSTKKVKRKHG